MSQVSPPLSADSINRVFAAQSQERADHSAKISSMLRGYFPLARDKTLGFEIDMLIDQALRVNETVSSGGLSGRIEEGRLLVVTGESGSGKTRALRHLFRRRSEFAGYAERDGTSVLVSITAPSPCTLRQLGKTLLGALGYDTIRDLRENVVWELVRRQIRLRGIRFIHIDECQHVFQTSHEQEVQKVRDTLKGLLQNPDWPICLILSGLPTVGDFVNADIQIRRRCRFVQFEAWSALDSGTIDGMIRTFAKRVELDVDAITAPEFISRLLKASFRQPGIAIEYVQDAAAAAVLEGVEAIEVRHFGMAYSARTGCAASANVFMSSAGELACDDEVTLSADNQIADGKAKRVRVERRK